MAFVGSIRRTEQKHLDLITLQHLVALELVLNLLVPLLALLLFCAHSTTHGDDGRGRFRMVLR